jgi:hypoxanthine phosphoribosyltransferase
LPTLNLSHCSRRSIQQRVAELAQQINNDFEGRQPIFVGILNGSFMFAADLVKEIVVPCEVTFTKLASYLGGLSSTRTIRDDFDLHVNITGKDVILWKILLIRATPLNT